LNSSHTYSHFKTKPTHMSEPDGLKTIFLPAPYQWIRLSQTRIVFSLISHRSKYAAFVLKWLYLQLQPILMARFLNFAPHRILGYDLSQEPAGFSYSPLTPGRYRQSWLVFSSFNEASASPLSEKNEPESTYSGLELTGEYKSPARKRALQNRFHLTDRVVQ